MRLIVLILAVFVMLSTFSNGLLIYAPLPIFALLAFWTLYLFRLLSVSALDPKQLSHSGVMDYWIWAMGTCFIPMMVLLFSRAWLCLRQDAFLKVISSISFATLTLIVLNLFISGPKSFLINGRLQLPSLNAISLGHVAALSILLSVFFLSRLRITRWFLLKIVAVLTVLAIGVVLLIFTGSRGPQLALVVSLSYFLLSQKFGLILKIVAVAVPLALIITPTVVSYIEEFNVGAIARILNVLDGSDSAFSSRLISYHSSLEVFYNNPILGKAIVEPVFGFYPHNILLEALMSTGLVGFVFLSVALFCGIRYGWYLLRTQHPTSWIALFYMQMLAGPMFSFAFYNNPGIRISLAGVIAIFSVSKYEIANAKLHQTWKPTHLEEEVNYSGPFRTI